jgi:CRISPR/Cas system Type II protein with McrA/HNH and RuvC-like nuclease domain
MQHPYQSKIEHFVCFDSRRLYNKGIKQYGNTVNTIKNKIHNFRKRGVKMPHNQSITIDDVFRKFGSNPCCYLTGRPIDVNQTRSYHFDHVVPVSKGGDNSLDNLGLCVKEANVAKNNLTVEQLIELCKDILQHHGYKITK